MQPGSEANERQLPASGWEDNIIPYSELIDKFEKLSESVNNPFKSIREFEATFTVIQEKVEKTHGKNLELKKELKYIKNYIKHQISQQQVGNQKVDRITFVLSIVIVSTAIYIWGDFLPQASNSLDYTKNIVFV